MNETERERESELVLCVSPNGRKMMRVQRRVHWLRPSSSFLLLLLLLVANEYELMAANV